MDCELQEENITKANGGRFDVPSNIIRESQQQQREYCYNAVLINSDGIISGIVYNMLVRTYNNIYTLLVIYILH